MLRKACEESIWEKKVWKRPLEIRKKCSENWLFEQEGAIVSGDLELCLVLEFAFHRKVATQVNSFEITGKSLSVLNR